MPSADGLTLLAADGSGLPGATILLDTAHNVPGAAACYPCGASASSEEGASVCECVGANRAYQESDGACICIPRYEFFDETLERRR